MIPVGEIRALRAEWQLRDDIIEKDYILGWLLAGIAADPPPGVLAEEIAEDLRAALEQFEEIGADLKSSES